MKRRNFFGSLLGVSALGVVASKVEAEVPLAYNPQKVARFDWRYSDFPENPVERSMVHSDDGLHVFKGDQWCVIDYTSKS